MSSKLLKNIVSAILIVFLGLASAVINWASPAKSEKDFPSSGIFSTGHKTETSNVSGELTLITYNMGYASGLKNNLGHVLTREEIAQNLNTMVATLKAKNPDVVALQEVDFFAKRSFDSDQARILADGLGLPYVAYTVTWNKRYLPWPYWPIRRQFGRVVSGQVILSRYPIVDQKTYVQDKPKRNMFWYNWFYLDRIFQHVQIDVNGKKISVWNVHLEAFDEATRLVQTQKLADLAKADSAALKFVMGDFNSASFINPEIPAGEKIDSPLALNIFAKQSEMSATESHTPVYTFPSNLPIQKIDHIFFAGEAALLESGAITQTSSPDHGKLTASDHLPVWVRLKRF